MLECGRRWLAQEVHELSLASMAMEYARVVGVRDILG